MIHHPHLFRQAAKSPLLSVSRTGSNSRSVNVRAQRPESGLISGIVSILTEGLRFAGVGKNEFDQLVSSERVAKQRSRPRSGDLSEISRRISRDFTRNSYIITGVIDDSVYDPDCFFADPTVSFSGLDLWKRNLQLLVPFLIGPSIELISIKPGGKNEQGAQTLVSEWRLKTTLSLPWRPLISVLGKTEYTLNKKSNQVVKHVETWNISGAEALFQILKPGAMS